MEVLGRVGAGWSGAKEWGKWSTSTIFLTIKIKFKKEKGSVDGLHNKVNVPLTLLNSTFKNG